MRLTRWTEHPASQVQNAKKGRLRPVPSKRDGDALLSCAIHPQSFLLMIRDTRYVWQDVFWQSFKASFIILRMLILHVLFYHSLLFLRNPDYFLRWHGSLLVSKKLYTIYSLELNLQLDWKTQRCFNNIWKSRYSTSFEGFWKSLCNPVKTSKSVKRGTRERFLLVSVGTGRYASPWRNGPLGWVFYPKCTRPAQETQ